MCGLWLLIAAHWAGAAEIRIQSVTLNAVEEGYSLSADFDIDLNRRLEEAVNKGVVLFFAVDFELTRSRWFWFDKKVVQRSRVYQLSYHALTRQYRLSTGGLHQSYDSLEAALPVLTRLRGWQVLEKGAVNNDQIYVAGLRMHLDLSQMAKTFQVSAISNREWNLSSAWMEWKFEPDEEDSPEPKAVPDARPVAESGGSR